MTEVSPVIHALHPFLAQAADGGGGGGAMGGIMGFAPFILIFVVMYFLIIRPQQKQAKEQQSFLSQLKKGDEVLLQSGFVGKVWEVQDAFVLVDIAPNTRVKVVKSTVSGPSPAAKLEAAAGKDAEKKS